MSWLPGEPHLQMLQAPSCCFQNEACSTALWEHRELSYPANAPAVLLAWLAQFSALLEPLPRGLAGGSVPSLPSASQLSLAWEALLHASGDGKDDVNRSCC